MQYGHHTGTTHADELLKTKIAPPRLPILCLRRDNLLAQLDAGLDQKLTWVSAPAGCGKTTLISQWLDSRVDTNIGWIALDQGDNDPVRFWRYFMRACESFCVNFSQLAETYLYQRPPSYYAMLSAFVNRLIELEDRHILVLDDYHRITSSEIHDAISMLIDHLPPILHLVIITRQDVPSLPFHELRILGELNEITAEDLRFSQQEIMQFFEGKLSLAIEPSVLRHFANKSEGWAGALRLAAINAQDKQSINDFLLSFSGGHPHIAPYIAKEILSNQPEDIQEFILKTSFLDRLTAPLCDAVTGRDDSINILESLEHANVLITVTNDSNRWYQYHTLFSDANEREALRRFNTEMWVTLHRRAINWFESQGLFSEAVETAIKLQDYGIAIDLIRSHREQLPHNVHNEYHTLCRWLKQVPGSMLEDHPDICFDYALAILFTANRRSPANLPIIEKLLGFATVAWHAENNTAALGRVQTVRAMLYWWQRDLKTSFESAKQAQDMLADDDLVWQGMNLLQVASAEMMAGHPKAASDSLARAYKVNQQVGSQHGVSAARHLLANVCLQQGRLHQAQQIYQQVLTDVGMRTEFIDDRGQALAGLAALNYEWNNLSHAEAQATEALNIARQLDAVEILVPAALVLARVQHAKGAQVQAQQFLRSMLAEISDSHLSRELQLLELHLLLRNNDTETVNQWFYVLSPQDQDFKPTVLREHEQLLKARLWIAQGEVDQALKSLPNWQLEAHENHRKYIEIQVLILWSLACYAVGDLPHAKRLLNRILNLVYIEGYQRVFLDEGESMITLLRATLPTIQGESCAMYARALLLAFAENSHHWQGENGAVDHGFEPIKPLSEQERRVLQLLSTGLSNPEIADHFFVSVNTVKTQVKSIFYKLNVSNRDEAAKVAQQLKL